MSYSLTSAEGDLDADWAGTSIGDTYDECVGRYEMEFLKDKGSGPHSVYQSNEWYYENVSKEEFFADPEFEDTSISYAEWWEQNKFDFKGVADWKTTKFTLFCDEKEEVIGDPTASEKATGVPVNTITTEDGKRVDKDTKEEVVIKEPEPVPEDNGGSGSEPNDNIATMAKVGASFMIMLALVE